MKENKTNNLEKKKITMISTFSGVGMQERGVENTNLFNLEVLATCEMDTNAIISYAAIHNNLTPELIDTYENYPSREEMANNLTRMNIGYDFKKKKPYDWHKVARSKDNKKLLQKIWLACKLNKNVGDICKVDSFPKCDLFTFSFPCTDLSVAGKQAGMVKGETRSGLVYEVLRILHNMKETNTLPEFMIMENVDALVNKKNLPQYEEINKELEEIGYGCLWNVENAKYTGIPQNRNRVYGLYYLKDKYDLSDFQFPKKFDNGIRLKDVLEDNVDEKYYITNKKAKALIEELILNGTLEDGEFWNGSEKEYL